MFSSPLWSGALGSLLIYQHSVLAPSSGSKGKPNNEPAIRNKFCLMPLLGGFDNSSTLKTDENVSPNLNIMSHISVASDQFFAISSGGQGNFLHARRAYYTLNLKNRTPTPLKHTRLRFRELR
jgi:hypothetical protein